MTVEIGPGARPETDMLLRTRWLLALLLLVMVVMVALRDRGAGPAGPRAVAATATTGDSREALLLPTH